MPGRRKRAKRRVIELPQAALYPRLSLLGLPGETRNQIWSLVAGGEHDVADLAVLRTCRTVYHELFCLPIFENTIYDLASSPITRGTNTRLHMHLRSIFTPMPPDIKARIKCIRARTSYAWLVPLLHSQKIRLQRLIIAPDTDGVENHQSTNRFTPMMLDILCLKVLIDFVEIELGSQIQMYHIHSYIEREERRRFFHSLDKDWTVPWTTIVDEEEPGLFVTTFKVDFLDGGDKYHQMAVRKLWREDLLA